MGDGVAEHPLGRGWVGPGARAGGDDDGGVLFQAAVAGGVIRGVVLPAAPDDAAPGAAEGPQGTAVVVAALAGVGVAVGRPRVPLAAAVRERAERVAQPLVARPAELRVPAFARLDRDRGLAAVGGDRVAVRVAPAAVADLGQQRGWADDRLATAEEAAEDLPVGVRVERLSDLGLELGDEGVTLPV